MTEVPPYWQNPLEEEFTVTIDGCNEVDDKYHVRIKENVIRPAGGGQAGDRGVLRIEDRAVQVLDTAAEESGIILITDSFVNPNQTAQLSIDIAWRKAMMMNHSAEHLFVGTIQQLDPDLKLGYIWIDGERAVVEIHGSLTDEILFNAERESQKIINQNIPLHSEFVDSSELDDVVRAREGVASKELVRIIRIGEYDASACSGTHVSSTRDIGFLKISDYKTLKDGVQLEILTGPRAIASISAIYNQVLQRKLGYPFELPQIGAVLDKGKRANEDNTKLVSRISDLISRTPPNEIINNISYRYEILSGFDSENLRTTLRAIPMDGPTAILLFAPGQKCNVILWTHELPREASDYIKPKVIELGGKGGGRGESFTGGFADVDEPEKVFEILVSHVRKELET